MDNKDTSIISEKKSKDSRQQKLIMLESLEKIYKLTMLTNFKASTKLEIFS